MKTDILDDVLAPHEKKSYLTLLSKGPMTVFELSKEASIARSKLYEVCERLVRKGLLEVSIGEKRRLYVAKDPINLLSPVEEQMRSLEETRYKLAELLPNLQKLHSMKKSEEEMVTVIKGESAIINHLESLSGSIKGAVVVAKALAPTKYRGRWERWLNTMKDKGATFRAIYEDSPKTREVAQNAKKFGFDVRFLREEMVGMVDWAVYDDRIFQIAAWNDATLIQVNSPAVAKVFLGIFETLWKAAQ